ncbi:MAG: hypothetical protein ACRDIU_09960 [Actinomycetota bacterium]
MGGGVVGGGGGGGVWVGVWVVVGPGDGATVGHNSCSGNPQSWSCWARDTGIEEASNPKQAAQHTSSRLFDNLSP